MGLERIGKYQVVAKIGEGAMGEVYKARDPLLNRNVAIKTISASLAADPQFKERFKREAQSAASLNHPNIVTVYEYGDDAGVTYIAMEFLEGVDLREAIRAKALGHLGRKLEVMEQISEGVASAHARGIVHRDLKPGNVHIQPSGHIKILDFGLAKLGASELTRSGTVMGTPHYMSPEQLRGQKADARADVFSLGAIFYEILSGQRAFENQPMHEVLARLRDREAVPLRKRAPATPALLVDVVERAMAREPGNRFKDAGELTRALARAREELAGETLAAPLSPEEASERTLLQAAGATIIEPRPKSRTSVSGSSALDVGGHHEPQRTMRPEATMAAGPPTEIRRRLNPLAAGAAVLALGAVAAVGFWLRQRTAAPSGAAATAAPAAQDQLNMITFDLVNSKLELARAEYENHDYAAAAASARAALDLDPNNADAKALAEQAEKAQQDLDAAVAEARAAAARGDTSSATAALGRVLALDSRHPVAAELSQSLNQSFHQQAEEARRQTAASRAAADKLRASALPEYVAAAKLTAEADTVFQREQFTAAAQKYLASRDGFEAARRMAESRAAEAARAAEATRLAEQARAEAARQASLNPQQPRPTYVPPPVTTTTVPSVRTQPSAVPSIAPSLAPTPLPTAAASASSPSPAAASASAADPRMAEIDRVLASYKHAYEALDVAALRAVMDLSPQQEKGLREAFKAFKSYGLDITPIATSFEADGRATVRVSRQDIINGQKRSPMRQVFVLGRQGDGWRIVSYSFEK
jgi:predicted Ser/Thr protein kinase/tetratricopeptide (TPR) repeat protein